MIGPHFYFEKLNWKFTAQVSQIVGVMLFSAIQLRIGRAHFFLSGVKTYPVTH